VYRHLHTLSLAYFDKQRTGNLMSTLSVDVPVVQNGIMGLRDILGAPIMALVGLVSIVVISPLLSAVTIIIFPFIALAMNAISRTLRAISLETQDRLADLSVITEETISGIRLVRSFAAEEREVSRYSRGVRAAKDVFMRGVRRSAILAPTTDVIGALGIAVAFFIGGHEVVAGALTFKKLATFVILLDRIRNGVSSAGNVLVQWKQVQGTAERIFRNVLDVRSDVVEKPNAIVVETVAGEVTFDHVSFEYVPGRPVIRDVSFTINPGEVVALVGPSGSGKSTLSDLIPRFYDTSEGNVLIDGINVMDINLASLRKHIGIVPQDTIVFGGSIRENISYGRPSASDEEVYAAARAANAHDFVMSLPSGYDTLVGERGVQLSGGQRQRLAIARALLKDPRILILDEATSSLDAASEIVVQDALEKLMQHRTTLVIAHRLSTVVNANRIVVLSDGRICETGTHADLIQRGGVYASLYESQMRGSVLDVEVPVA